MSIQKPHAFLLLASLLAAPIASATVRPRANLPLPPKQERKLYVGKDSTEAVLTFDHWVEIQATRKPSMKKAREKIEAQLEHLFGPMAAAKIKAVPRGNHEITNVKIAAKEGATDTFIATYSYKGTAVIGNGATETYSVLLPVNPDTIYAAGEVKRNGEATYPCTDPHYESEGDFWYFWNPAKFGCPLKEQVHYTRVQAKLQRIANTTKTYPEYERMTDATGMIHITMLFGMDDPDKTKNPLSSKDINAGNFLAVKESLLGLGFKSEPWSATKIRSMLPKGQRTLPYVEELVKKDPRATLVVRMFFGPSGIDENSTAFHYFFKDAMENSAIMIYDGHSGLGGHLDLPSIEEMEGFQFAPNPNRYQIYFFNSCTSYTYYNTMFFGRKVSEQDPKGTKNLDILTNGLSTYFYVMHDTNLALIKAIDAWASGKAVVSYQELAKQIDSGNLFGINGDEDNPTNTVRAPEGR